jgi:ATP-binding cassette subfamily C protein LapB
VVFALADEGERDELELPRPRGEILLDDVSFRYGSETVPVIDGLKAQIKPPGLLGIVGANGSGKTTLLKLLQGLYAPSAGRVLLDGGDVAQFSRAKLARWIGYVPQECVLFSGSIRDNLMAGRPDAGDDEVLQASTIAGLHGRVLALPEGYGTEVGEGGLRLPGGLRQRVAIARALVGDPAVLLLDEPTNNLDREGEDELRRSLATLARDRMVVVVTHSPALLAACAVVMVLDRGKIARAGPPADMLSATAVQAPAPVRLNR